MKLSEFNEKLNEKIPSWVPFFGVSDKRPVLLELRSSKIFILSAVSIAIFTDIFLYGVIVPVVPFSLTTRVGIAEDHVQYWVSVLLAVYGACLLAASPFWGWIADRTTTRRAPLLFGLLILTGATVLLTEGSTIGLLIAGRALQGFSAAIVWITGLALLVDTVGKEALGEALGYVSLSMSLAILIAPLLGGVVFNRAGYYSVFAMCFGLLGLDIVLRLVMIERRVAAKWLPHLDTRRQGSSSSTEASSPELPRSPTRPAVEETKEPEPNTLTVTTTNTTKPKPKRLAQKLPPVITLLTSVRLLSALWGSLVQAVLLTAFDSTLPIFVRELFGWDSLGAGLIFLAVVIPTFLAPLAGWASDKYGGRWLCAAGFLFAVPFLVLLRLVDHNSIGQKVLLCAFLALFGATLVLVLPPIMAEIALTTAAREEAHPGLFGEKGAYAQAYGLFNMAFAAGTLIGPLWGGLVNERAGWGTMTATLAALSGATAVPALLFTGGWVGKKLFLRSQQTDAAETETEEGSA